MAIRQGKSLSAVIEDALRELLSRDETRGEREIVRLVTFKGQGLLPGVDLDDSSGLLERMKETG
ncbi:MAG: DUF2191 domain-containing protein [Chloroflexi bacterium]|nr:DUF2191 domain-containing protein [Chloroflexota bacterium]